AMGHCDEPLSPLAPPAFFVAHRAFMEPVITPESLEAALASLLARLVSDLEKKSQGAMALQLKLFRTDGSRFNLSASLAAPSHDLPHLLRLLKPKLETLDAGFGIDAMTLEASETAPAIVQQFGFMENGNPLGLEQLSDRVMNRHGAGISTLQTVESHIPERAEIPQFPHPGVNQSPSKAKNQRPLLIFNRPEPAIVIAAVPDGPPMRFIWRRITHRVMRSQGPERIAPEWWRLDEGASLPRDYYMIEDGHGRRYWLYREGLYGEAEPKWFVHGLSP
ncbi:MAG: Y-family DNA polymerase, partial [Methylocella sp.]